MSGISLQIAVQPPAVTCLGAILNPPLAVTMSRTTTVNGYNNDLSRVWAFATLINHGEFINDNLSGTLAESAHALPNGDDSTDYFLFDNLSIKSVGSFRIRVTLMGMDNSNTGAASLQQIESNPIEVEDRDVVQLLPSASEQRFLDMLAN